MATSPQRAWRAPCPNCGAPVEFLSAASASAVCSFCRSTLVRDGADLRKIGTSAEIFDDFSPLALGASGSYQGTSFMLVGRLQFGTDDGPWSEWHALFDNGRSGWLSEDNGRYVFAFDAPAPADAPRPTGLRAGAPLTVDGRRWSVASVVQAKLLAAQGELPQAPPASGAIVISDLRNVTDEVATLMSVGDETALHWSIGKSVRLADLKMSGLRETGIGGAGEKTLQAKSPPCPNCGAPLKITLATSQSVVCDSCKSVVDLSQGIGPDMAHYAQLNRMEPGIALGRTGTLPIPSGNAPQPWQVVGYMERMELMGGASDATDEAEAWREYLLYNRTEGFAFLVDTNEGWSVVRVLTGVPEASGDTARWYGTTYQRRWTYTSQNTYVLGEFYWKVEANQQTQHQDYEGSASGHRAFLSRESTPNETTWSAGESIPAAMVASTFGLAPTQAAQLQRSAGPPSLGSLVGAGGLISWPTLLLILFVVIVLLAMCSRDPCRNERRAFGASSLEYQQCKSREAAGTGTYYGTGGAWGGYSSGGGGHK